MGRSDNSSEDDDWGDIWSGPGHAWTSAGSPGERGGQNNPSSADTGEQASVSDRWEPTRATHQVGNYAPQWPPNGPPPPGHPQSRPMPQGYPTNGMGPQFYPEPKKSGNGTKIALALVLALILIPVVGVLGYMLAFTGDDNSTEAQNVVVPAETTGGSATDSNDSDTGSRADGFVPPASWNQCSGDGEMGQLNYSYAATPVTSCPFAIAVRDAVAQHYHETDGDTDSVLNVRSPVTDTTYAMTCTDDGTVVTCVGGNNAEVKIV